MGTPGTPSASGHTQRIPTEHPAHRRRARLNHHAVGDDMSAPVPRSERVITNRAELAAAAVEAFLNGDAETRQHIVDTLGERVNGRSTPEVTG